MPNTFLKADQIAATTLGLLQREIVLPRLTWLNAVGDYAGAKNDTISIRVPGTLDARFRALRDHSQDLMLDTLDETKIDVTLTTDIYSGVPVTDEELELDISSFGGQILAPQVRAVAEGLENAVADMMTGQVYDNVVSIGGGDPFDAIIDARTALNKNKVPAGDRILVAGADVEAKFLKSDHFNRVDQAGTDSALREAHIGRVAGVDVISSLALPPDTAFLFHRTAFILCTRAPRVPDGASYGNSQSYQGLAMRWLRDYDPFRQTDRSFVNTWMGVKAVIDGPGATGPRTVTVTGSPTGGTFTLTYGGQTTSGIAYNATASVVRNALNALRNIDQEDVTVTGSAGGPYTVNIRGGGTLSASGSGLTGGSSPNVTVGAGSNSTASFARAVKITL